jgi:phage gpG-like protein
MAGEVVFDDREWRGFIDHFRKELGQPRKLLRVAFATAGFRDVIDHFGRSEGPKNPWQPRAASTQAAYARKHKTDSRYNPSNKLLILTGGLRQGFLPSNVEDKDATSIVFFNPTPHAAVHDNGSKKKGIPQREFMWLSGKAQETMLNIILDKAVGP